MLFASSHADPMALKKQQEELAKRASGNAELEVKDKRVLMFRYMPEEISPQHRQHLVNYFDLRCKASVARDNGARGLITVSGPNSQVKDQLLRNTGKNLKALQYEWDSGKTPRGFTLEVVSLQANISIRQEQAPDYIEMQKLTGSVTRRNLRAYLGTIPEYGDSDIKGVKPNGVAKGGLQQWGVFNVVMSLLS